MLRALPVAHLLNFPTFLENFREATWIGSNMILSPYHLGVLSPTLPTKTMLGESWKCRYFSAGSFHAFKCLLPSLLSPSPRPWAAQDCRDITAAGTSQTRSLLSPPTARSLMLCFSKGSFSTWFSAGAGKPFQKRNLEALP